ncbi:hypothetical protein DFP73DRAFT_210654 [Morchella snyderi]|nr:hypothetical protein DFP73DRAFT_210654 [Morchella snyderi]
MIHACRPLKLSLLQFVPSVSSFLPCILLSSTDLPSIPRCTSLSRFCLLVLSFPRQYQPIIVLLRFELVHRFDLYLAEVGFVPFGLHAGTTGGGYLSSLVGGKVVPAGEYRLPGQTPAVFIYGMTKPAARVKGHVRMGVIEGTCMPAGR